MVDGGNGMAGPMVGPILRDLGLELIEAYWTPDGSFPDHEPNPLLQRNREFIMREVVDTGADLGIAWDGDGDRCFFIDEQGAFIDGDFLTALMAESMLEKQPKSTILYDVRASRAVADVVEGAGGRALMNRVGHAFFKTRMREEHAIFGGEVSGHYYFHDFFCADSGTIPALLMIELLSVRQAPSRRSCSRPTARGTSSPARSTRRSPMARPRSRSCPSATPTRTSTASTGSRWSTTTGTSTCAPRTPSRCCGCAWSRWPRARTWSAAVTRCSA